MKSSLIKKIAAYEGGYMDDKEVIEFFQYLISTDLACRMGEHYQRTAKALIQTGICFPRGGRKGV